MIPRTPWTPEDRQIFASIADTSDGDIWAGGYLDADDDSCRSISNAMHGEGSVILNALAKIELTETFGDPIDFDSIY